MSKNRARNRYEIIYYENGLIKNRPQKNRGRSRGK